MKFYFIEDSVTQGNHLPCTLLEAKIMAKERPPLEEMTLRQLRKVASEYSISRYSRMRKSQLLAAIQEVQRSKISLRDRKSVV